ncbi:MAG: phosphoribosyltransferase family protein [Pseudonocardiales bacterium]|nr:phosphoribosyltransferase family protein [Pseudonocardiales bacterium]
MVQGSRVTGHGGWAQPPVADWLTRELGARLVAGHGDLHDQVGLALRLNPRRAHLLVSAVLGKYVPTHPGSACRAGTTLGRQVAGCLGASERSPLVVGYAETATALGHLVADVLGAPYLHSTRRAVPGGLVSAAFTEPHSHAPGHLLLPAHPDMLGGGGPLVLVDDELSTGTTAANTIEAVHARYPRHRYVVASLMDVRSLADSESMAARVAALGAHVEVVSLARGAVELPDDMLSRSARLVAAQARRAPAPHARHPNARLSGLRPAWPAGLPDGGRHGFTPVHRFSLEAVVADIAAGLTTMVRGRRVLVLGCEEFMYVPLRVAQALQRCLARGSEVHYASTARSPVLAVDDSTYPIRTRLAFPAHDRDAGSGWRFVYNVAPGNDPARRFDDVVCVLDDAMNTPALRAAGGLLDILRGVCDRVSVVVVPSYRPGRDAAGAQTGSC